jgi:Kef-type K+ transport system membrane component KefB
MMHVSEVPGLMAGILMLLAAAHTIGRLFELFKLPRVIGEIVGGLLIGPTLLLHFFPTDLQTLFGNFPLRITVVQAISQLGLVLLMFESGTYLRSFVRAGERKVVSYLAVVGIVIPFAIGMLAASCLDTTSLQGPASNSTAFALIFATAIAIASIPVISRIMMDLGIMDTAFARIVLTTAVLDDLVLYGVLAVALALARAPGSTEFGLPALLAVDSVPGLSTIYHILATLSLMVAIVFLTPGYLRRANGSSRRLAKCDNGALIKVALLAGVTAASIVLNVNPMFAALVAGMVVGRSAAYISRTPSKTLQLLGSQLFIPLYFALVGFKLDLVRHFDIVAFISFLVFACITKSISIYAAARIGSQSNSDALKLAAALNARGGPGIVLATVAFDAQVINENFYAILVLTAIVTSLLAGICLAISFEKLAQCRYVDFPSKSSVSRRQSKAI